MISMIAAVGKNNEIGKDNKLLWNIQEDLKNFKNITMGKKIVMGAKTYYSLPKILEGREYIVLSKKITSIPNGQVFRDFTKLLKYLDTLDEEVVIIGGASVYKLFIDYASKLYITEIEAKTEADAYFPPIKGFKKEVIKEMKENNLKYRFVIYKR